MTSMTSGKIDFELSLEELPEGTAPEASTSGAHVLACGLRQDDGRPSAFALFRQRRSARGMRLIGWSCTSGQARELAEAVEAFAAARQIVMLRAMPDQVGAAELGLVDTGRGYLERWLSDRIDEPHQTGGYIQSTGFTCGPVSLAMAIGPDVTRQQEIALWRRATTLIGLNGPGGCDPYGLALAARDNGFDTRLYFDSEKPVLLDRASNEERRELMCFVQAELRAEAEVAMPVIHRQLPKNELEDFVSAGRMVLLLIDQIFTHDEHVPHWVLAHAFSHGIFLVNDPWAEKSDGETIADSDRVPITSAMLHEMAQYGDPPYHAALVL